MPSTPQPPPLRVVAPPSPASGRASSPRRSPAEDFAGWVQARKPSLRTQFALCLLLAGAAALALILFVSHAGPAASQPDVPGAKALAIETQEGNIVVGQDQAPHIVRTAALTIAGAAAAARAAVLAYMNHQIAIGTISGPVTASSCTAAAASTPSRLVFRCGVTAASVLYPFDLVAAPADRTLTYCKVDAAPVAGEKIPVSARCR